MVTPGTGVHIVKNLGERGRFRFLEGRTSRLFLCLVLALVLPTWAAATENDTQAVSHRLIIQLDKDSGLIVDDDGVKSRDRSSASRADATRLDNDVLAFAPDATLERLFTRSIAELDADRAIAAARSGKQAPDLNVFGLLDFGESIRSRIELEEIARKLRSVPGIASVRIDLPTNVTVTSVPILESATRTTSAPIYETPASTTPDFSFLQGYRGAPETGGTNMDAVWDLPAARGASMKFIDIEQGWWLDHEDLPDFFFEHYLDSLRGEYHGTAVLGELVAQDNGFGMLGMVPDAQFGVVNVYWVSEVVDAINIAGANLDEGDVYLIELQYQPNGRNDICMEYDPGIHAAIRLNSLNGRIAVEAAANGNQNLDDWLTSFVRYSPTDSLAIMVGSATPDGTTPIPRSNYGERVDVNGWGSDVASTGGRGDLYFPDENVNRSYTEIFGGTSSATPIVAGAVISLQSMYKNRYGVSLDPVTMRDLITTTGVPHQPHTKNVGPRPDILRAWEVISDDFPPEAIDDLWAGSQTSTHVNLIWHAPIDRYLDGEIQAVAAYDIRHSLTPITEANFDSATRVAYTGPHWPSNSVQGQLVEGLAPSSTYFFAVKSSDAKGNVSPISNIAEVTTLAPEPELEVTVSEYRDPLFVGNAENVRIQLKNRGSLDLTVSDLTILYASQVDFAMAPFVGVTLSPGDHFDVAARATLTAAGLQVVVFNVVSNDPQGIPSPVFTATGVASPPAIEAQVCQGGSVTVETELANPLGEPMSWRVDGVSDSSAGPVLGEPGPYSSLNRVRVAIDGAHVSSVPSDLLAFTLQQGQSGAMVYTQAEITPETLADVDLLVAPAIEISWTTSELDALADWLASGGNLLLETAPTPLMLDETNAILDRIGSGTTVAWDPDNSLPLVVTGLADHLVNWGVSVMYFGADGIAYNEVELNVDPADVELAWTENHEDVKIALGTSGAGRFAVVGAPLTRNSIFNGAHNAQFMKNLSHWLTRRVDWVSPVTHAGVLASGSTGSLAFEIDPERLPLGAVAAYVALEVSEPSSMSALIPMTVDTRISTLTIENLSVAKLGLGDDCGKSRVTWTTSEPTTGTVQWGLKGAGLDQTAFTGLRTSHSVLLPTAMATYYTLRVTADSPTCGVPVEEEIDWKTVKVCISEDGP